MPNQLIHPLLRRAAPTLAKHGTITEMFYGRDGEDQAVYAFKLLPHKPLRGVVLFVHGTGNDACYPFIYLFLTILEAGFAVMSFDLDGHGRLSKTVGKLATFMHCIDRAMEQCRKEFSDAPLFLLGHSLGGILSLNFMRTNPHAVQGAVILATPCKPTFTWRMMLPEVAASIHSALLEQKPLYGWKHLLPAFGSFGRASYPLRLEGQEGAMEYVRFVSTLFQQYSPEKMAPEIKEPVLCIYGRYDWIAPASDGKNLAHSLPRGQFREIPQANHLMLPFLPETSHAVVGFFQSV